MEKVLASLPESAGSTAQDLMEGIASLSRGSYFREASLDMSLSILTESASQMATIDRVSIWAVTDAQRELRCLEYFESFSGRHGSGGVRRAEQFPVYFRTLSGQACVAADAVEAHPATVELSRDEAGGVRALSRLEMPIHIRGDWQGVLSFEQFTRTQHWRVEHCLFAQAVANLVSLALVEYEASEAKRSAHSANQRLRAVFAASREAMMLIDGETAVILDVNPMAEQLFGLEKRDLVGRHQRQLYPLGVESTIASLFRQSVLGQQTSSVRTTILGSGGATLGVEVSAQRAEISDVRRVALAVFRPV